MPRTRLVWRLFASWCGFVLASLVACSWLASIELARLSDLAEYRRMDDVARMAAATAPTDSLDANSIARWQASAESLGRTTQLRVELFDPSGNPALPNAALPEPGEASPGRSGTQVEIEVQASSARRGDADALSAVRAGSLEARSNHYDADQGRRVLTLARAANDRWVILVASESALVDELLRSSQRSLLLRILAAVIVAIAVGYLIAKRAASGVEELADSASLLASGALDIAIPTPDIAELDTIARAVQGLRDQLLERARTIGRQGSQQEAVLGSMVEGVLAVDRRYRLLSINTAAAELLGLDPGKVLLRPLQEVVRNPDLRRFVLRVLDCKEPIEDDLVLRDATRERVLLVRGTALRSPSGGDHGAVIVLNDVTNFRHLENIRRDFVANVSHELKTPTASIRGFVETLMDGAIENRDDAQRFLAIIARQAERLEAIIEDLLALSRIERIEESSDLVLETVPLMDVIAAAIGSCQLRAVEREIEVTVSGDPAVLVSVNPPLLEQALINLIDNAIKYSEAGKMVRITVSREASDATEDRSITITVADEGCGIEEQFLPRIFERFYRVDRGRSRKLGGTGLGLSIVKHIVQAHGGSVDVKSTPGVGSVFALHLPWRQPHEAPA
jgi:two-component system phosphate regulon sensor histidine kinase PhoR